MNLSDFQQSAERTMVAGMPGVDLMLNAALGLCEEAAELDECARSAWGTADEEIVNEAGDLLWYAAQMCKAFGKSIAAVSPDLTKFRGWDDDRTTTALYRNTGAIAGMVKKRVFHGKPINPIAMLDCLQSIVGAAAHIMAWHEQSLEMALEHNHQKRRSRHPDGFSFANARTDAEPAS